MEMVENAAKNGAEISQPSPLKRLVINLAQFEYLLNLALNPLNQSVKINESEFSDTYTFELYSGRMKKFLDFVKTQPTISVSKMKKDGHYVYLTLANSGRFEEWEPMVKYYKEHIKI